MGSDWSFPCVEREKIRRKVPLLAEPDSAGQEFKPVSIAIDSVSIPKLQRHLNRPQADYILSSVSSNPANSKALLFSQLQSDLEYSFSPSGEFTVSIHHFSSCENLEAEIQEKYSKGYSFIGGVSNPKALNLIYFQTGVKFERKISVKLETGFGLEELKAIFLEEIENLFLGCILFGDSALFVFEKMMTPRPILYFVAEFPKDEIQVRDFEGNLTMKIHECVSDNEVRFRACISYKSCLYLIFIQ